jgi:methylase of polypeptide subunit release factors
MTQSTALGQSGEKQLTFLGQQYSLQLRPDVAAPNYYTDLVLTGLSRVRAKGLAVGDLGSGTGIVAVIARQYLAASYVWAIDVNPSAVELTQVNCARNQCDLTKLAIVEGDFLSVWPSRKLDLLVANPPQIPTPTKDAEPTCSGGFSGRDVMRTILSMAAETLTPKGQLLMTAADFIGIAELSATAAEFGMRLRTIDQQRCVPGPYTLKQRDHIERSGYFFDESSGRPEFVLYLLSISRD